MGLTQQIQEYMKMNKTLKEETERLSNLCDEKDMRILTSREEMAELVKQLRLSLKTLTERDNNGKEERDMLASNLREMVQTLARENDYYKDTIIKLGGTMPGSEQRNLLSQSPQSMANVKESQVKASQLPSQTLLQSHSPQFLRLQRQMTHRS